MATEFVGVWSAGIDANGDVFTPEAIQKAIELNNERGDNRLPILWNFDQTKVIGKAENVVIDDDGYVLADVTINNPDIAVLIADGILNTASIQPQFMYNSQANPVNEDGVRVINECVLACMSLCPTLKTLEPIDLPPSPDANIQS